jgi:hypothetical protein
MVERSELIIVCRQIGGMMQAGVDILRITRVLRAQTDNPRLLQLYDALDHDLTMGRSLADALERAPDVWSPFIVSLVQQGEERNDLAGAFLSAADYLLKEGELEASTLASSPEPAVEPDASTRRTEYSQPAPTPVVVTPVVPGEALSHVVEAFTTRVQSLAVNVLLFATALMLAWAIVWWSAAVGWLPLRWVFFVLCSVAALLCVGAAVWVQQQIENRRAMEAQSALADQDNNESTNLHVASDAHSTDEMTAATLHDGEHGSGNAAVAAEPNGVGPSAIDAVVPAEDRLAGGNRASSQTGTVSTTASSRANTRQAEEDYE